MTQKVTDLDMQSYSYTQANTQPSVPSVRCFLFQSLILAKEERREGCCVNCTN